MAEIGGDFKLDVSGAIAALQKVDAAILGVSKRALGITAAFAGFAALGSFLKSTTDRAIESAGSMESLNAEFRVLLGSAQAAESMLGSLKGTDLARVFGLDAVADGAKTMLAFGASAESILPSLSAIGDIAGSNKQKFDSLVLAFSQMSAAGRLMGQDLLQMVNAGFNPLQEISRTTGRALVDLKKDMEGGAISAAMVADAFRSATSEGGRFFGNLEAQAGTWNGKMSQLHTAIDAIYRSFGQPLIVALKPVLDDAIASATAFAPVAGHAAEMIVAMGHGVGMLTPLLAALSPLWIGLAARILKADTSMVRFLSRAGGAAWTSLLTSLRAANTALSAYAVALGSTGSHARAAQAALVTFATTGTAAMAGLAVAVRAVGVALKAIGRYLLIGIGIELLMAVVSKVMDFVGGKWKASSIEKSTPDMMNEQLQQVQKISTSGDRDRYLASARAKAESLRAEAATAGNADVEAAYKRQADLLDELIEKVEKMPVAAADAQDAMAAAATAAAEKTKDSIEAIAAAEKSLAAARLAQMSPEDRKMAVLNDVGDKSTGDLDARIGRWREAMKSGSAEDWQYEQMPKLLAAREKLLQIEKEIADEKERAQKAADERTQESVDKLAKQYDWREDRDNERAILDAQAADAAGGDGLAEERVRLEQRRVDLIKEAVDLGGMEYAQALDYAATIVDAEKKALDAKRERQKAQEAERAAEQKKEKAEQAAEWKQNFDFEMRRKAAEVAGDKEGARRIEIEQRRQGYIREGMEQGGLSEADATRLANQRAALDAQQLDGQKGSPQRQRIDALFADSLARVGGGGGVAGRGGVDPVLRESERQSGLLRSLVTEVRGLRDQVKRGGPLVAVAS